MELIPSLDLLNGRVVRLTHGDFETARTYGEPEAVLDALDVPRGTRLHVVDLEASRSGRPIETNVVRRLAMRDLIVQVGGGIRSLDDARRWLDCGAERIVVGTVAAESPALLASLIDAFGANRIVPAVDVRDGVVRTDGWSRASATPLAEVFARIEALGIEEALVTDISRDGVLRGPSFALYRELRALTRVRLIASGGVSTRSDLVSLSRLSNVSGCVIGRALLEGRLSLANAPVAKTIPERVIPCLDVRDGRVVKGVSFEHIRDAGDPVECAMRYEAEGADELVLLDISATDRAASTALDTVRRVAESLFISLTVGGGVRTLDDFRALLRAGADRVAINTAALRRPELIRECAEEFGVQAVVLSCDARGGFATVRGGRELTDVNASEWCARAEELGAGEILLTSVDRDGTSSGFDLELLRAVTSRLTIGVIASGGAGTLAHFRDAIESGGARAVLAASLFHDRLLSVGEVKQYLAAEGIPIR
ncbi:MAG TPA: imidazole glycerol phosphate synthase subunit HisF [Thermoanaerobaculia bacterium]|jgi:cyclase